MFLKKNCVNQFEASLSLNKVPESDERKVGSCRNNINITRQIVGVHIDFCALADSNEPVKRLVLQCILSTSREETQFQDENFKLLPVMYKTNFQR